MAWLQGQALREWLGGHLSHRQENEGHDRSTIALPDGQLSLASALSAANTGTPLVCVLIHGGSLAPATLMYALDFKGIFNVQKQR